MKYTPLFPQSRNFYCEYVENRGEKMQDFIQRVVRQALHERRLVGVEVMVTHHGQTIFTRRRAMPIGKRSAR
jgi:hypothetical protein